MKKLSKKDKILLTIFNEYKRTNQQLRYEDLLVKIFKDFPKDFQIRYYPEYPDTDTIRRAMYQLIPDGYLVISNRNCSLTYEGRVRGESISQMIDNYDVKDTYRIDSNLIGELNRIRRLEGFQLFISDKFEKILDKDFFELYKASVRTGKLELEGKIKIKDELVKTLISTQEIYDINIINYILYLKENFEDLFKRDKSEYNS